MEKSFRRKLLIAIIAFATVPVLANSMIYTTFSSANVTNTKKESLEKLTYSNGVSLSKIIEMQMIYIESFAEAKGFIELILENQGKPLIEGNPDVEQVENHLQRLMTTNEFYDDALIVDASGRILARGVRTTGQDKLVNISQLEFFSQAMKNPNETYISDQKEYGISETQEIEMSHAIRADDGEVIGVVVLFIDSTFFDKFLENVAKGVGWEALIIDGANKKLFGSGIENVGSNDLNVEFELIIDHARRQGDKNYGTSEYKSNGTTFVMTYYILQDFDWVLVIRQSKSQILAHIYTFSLLSLGLLVCLVGTSIFAARWLTRAFMAPIDRLKHTFAEAADTEFYKECTVEGDKEFQDLARSYNVMIGKLKYFTVNLEQTVEERTRELKEMTDRAENAAAIKSQFLAHMSHEIRTPMNAIVGMSDILMEGALNPKQQNYMKDIQTSANSLLSIINDILDISKIEAGKLDLTPVDFDFMQFIDNVLSLMEFTARIKGIEIKVEVPEGMPRYLFGDDVRMRQILLNIIGNAIKFTQEGHVKLEVQVKEEYIIFIVEDTGIGMRPETLPKIFEAFEQADTERNRHIKGTGLGLAITKNLVEMMSGTIEAQSQINQGTTFCITIPLIIGDPDKVVSEANTKPLIKAIGAKVLLVDDNEVNLHVGEGLLAFSNIIPDFARNGLEAIERIKQQEYDLVFMDHMMPIMDGIEATAKIRNLGGKYATLPIIALTANAIQGMKEQFLEAGMDDFLSKPINRVLLNRTLKKWLPAEKIMKAEEVLKELPEFVDHSPLDEIRKIPGLDVDTGLAYLGDNIDLYQKCLEIFNQSMGAMVEGLITHLENQNMKDLVIDAHSVKSSLMNVGHMELAEKAKDLEIAAQSKDIAFCTEKLPGLVEEIIAFNEQLTIALRNSESKAQEQLALGEQRIAAFVAEISKPIFAYDQELAMDIMNKYKGYSLGDKAEMFAEIGEALHGFEFDLAEELLEKLRGMGK